MKNTLQLIAEHNKEHRMNNKMIKFSIQLKNIFKKQKPATEKNMDQVRIPHSLETLVELYKKSNLN